MYFEMLFFARFLRYCRSSLTDARPTFRVVAICLWLCPLTESSLTLSLRHCNLCSTFVLKCSLALVIAASSVLAFSPCPLEVELCIG